MVEISQIELSAFIFLAECASPFPLGMENGKIKTTMVTGSTFESGHKYQNGRLNGAGSWVSKNEDSNPHMQVDLTMITIILGVSTQGNFLFLY